MGLKILLVDDHKIVRDGLRSLIDRQPGMEVAAEAENGRQAIRLTRQLRPDVIVMDLTMPDLNGIEATRQITQEFPEVKIVAFSMHADQQFVEGAFKAGVAGYLLKDSAFEDLAKAIRAVAANKSYLSPKITDLVVKGYVGKLATAESLKPAPLTGREREVLQMIAEGRTAKQIAKSLNVSIKTAETHRRNIMEKLGIYSIAELTKFAIREGLTSLDT